MLNPTSSVMESGVYEKSLGRKDVCWFPGDIDCCKLNCHDDYRRYIREARLVDWDMLTMHLDSA